MERTSSHILFALAAALLSGLMSATAPAHAGTQYEFTVTCPAEKRVVEWGIGAIDPVGKEYFRVITGTKFPGCQITDFNPQLDASLPRERYSDAKAVINAVPGVQIICGLFRC